MQTDKTTLNTVEEEQRLAVKVALGDDKRVLLLSGPSYALLATKVAAAFNLPAGSFAVRYLDDEKDHVTASSDEELQVALQFASGSGLLRLDVVPLQRSPVAGEKRPRRRSVDESDDAAFVDPQAVAYLAHQMHHLHAIEVKPKKCAKFLRRSDGDVAQAQILLDAWCHKRAAKALKKKQEKKQKKDRHHKVAVDRCGEEESPEIKEKLDQLEARGYSKRKKNAKVLAKCEHDFEKALEVLECKAAKKEAKREWKCAKKEKKLGKKALKREYKLERKGSKAAFKKHKKNCKREAKLLKQQYRGLSYQELSSATTSPMLATAGGP